MRVLICGLWIRFPPGSGRLAECASPIPGERDLRRRGLLPPSDALQQIDHRHVGGARVRRKARRDAAKIAAAEGRVRVDLAGRKASTERTKRDEADSEFLTGGEHAIVFDIARPQ